MAELKIKIKGFTGHLNRAISSAQSKLAKFGITGKAVMGGIKSAIGVVTGTMGALVVGSIRASAEFEKTAVSFKTMLKSASLANKVLADLTDFSTKTPFTPKEVFAAAKTLLSFGTDVDKVNDIMKTLGDVSSGTGKDLNELARIYGKVFVKGKAQGEELNQMSEAGIPILIELQKQYGVTASEIFKMGSQGKISFSDIDTAMQNMTSSGGIFFDAMIAQSETLIGKVSTLEGNWSELLRTIGDTDGAKKGIDFLNSAVQGASGLVSMNKKDPNSAWAAGLESMQGTFLGLGAAGIAASLFSGKAAGVLGGSLSEDLGKAATGNEIRNAREAKASAEKAAADAGKEAARKKSEIAARELSLGKKTAAGMIKNSVLGGGGTLASLGGDISGGGFSARMNVAQEQLTATIEIRDLTRDMVKNSTTLNSEGQADRSRSMAQSAIKD